jgi:hypothetical protein
MVLLERLLESCERSVVPLVEILIEARRLVDPLSLSRSRTEEQPDYSLSEGARLSPVTVTPRQDSLERQVFVERRPVQPEGRDLDPAHIFLGGRLQP